MDKYSIKCGKFVLDHSFFPITIPKNKKTLWTILDLIEQVDKLEFKIENKQEELIHLLNKDDFPVVYQVMTQLFKGKKLGSYLSNFNDQDINLINKIFEKNNFAQFVNWYQENHRWIDSFDDRDPVIKGILNKLYDVNKDRAVVNRMVFDNPFVSLDVQRYVEIHDLIYQQYVVDNIVINVYQIKEDINRSKINIDSLFRIIKVMCRLAKKEPRVQINILLTNLKKRIGKSGSAICPIHVNTGSTLKGEYINIWRSEELEKVLIHELIHYLELDFNVTDVGYYKIDQYLKNRFNVEGVILLNEGWTEALASIIHTCWILNRISFNREKIWDLINLEVNFGLFQCAKILKHFNMQSVNNLFERSKNKIKQKTAIFSYFFVRSSLLVNLEQLVELLDKNIYFASRFDDFIELMDRSLKSDRFKNGVRRYIDLITTENIFIMKTLRMTCLQINQTKE